MGNNKITLDIKENDKLYQNTNQEWIVTTKDKLRIVLMESEKTIGEKKSWVAPLGLFITTLIALVSADFKKWIFSADVWCAIFVIVCAISGVFALTYGIKAVKNSKSGNIDSIIDKIIKESKK